MTEKDFYDVAYDDFYCPHCDYNENLSDQAEDFCRENKMFDMKNGEIKEIVCPACDKKVKVKAYLTIGFETKGEQKNDK